MLLLEDKRGSKREPYATYERWGPVYLFTWWPSSEAIYHADGHYLTADVWPDGWRSNCRRGGRKISEKTYRRYVSEKFNLL